MGNRPRGFVGVAPPPRRRPPPLPAAASVFIVFIILASTPAGASDRDGRGGRSYGRPEHDADYDDRGRQQRGRRRDGQWDDGGPPPPPPPRPNLQDGGYRNGEMTDSGGDAREWDYRKMPPPPPDGGWEQGPPDGGWDQGPPPPRRSPPPPRGQVPPPERGRGGPPPAAPVAEPRSGGGPPRTPINYNFPEAGTAAAERRPGGDRPARGEWGDGAEEEERVPMTRLPPDYHERGRRRRRRGDGGGPRGGPDFMSPRRDAVSCLASTKAGRAKLVAGSAAVGYGLGTFLAKSALPGDLSRSVGPASAALFAALTFLRNDYGELSKSLGAALLLVLGRVRDVRRRYPTRPHLKAVLAMGRREPFPPNVGIPDEDGNVAENPWTYRPREMRDLPPRSDPDPDFSMVKSALATAMVGGICGGDLPLIPTWMGAAGGAAALAFLTTLRSARGDLARTAGMRVVALLEEVLDVNAELGVVGKAGTVGGKIFDRVMILDRKHRIKDRLTAVLGWVFDRASGAVRQVQSDMQEQRE